MEFTKARTFVIAGWAWAARTLARVATTTRIRLRARPSCLLLAAGLLPLLFACGGPEDGPEATIGSAQAVVPPTSARVTIDLSAGMPGQSHWRYLKGQDSTTFAAQSFDDSAWSQVGIPHGANYLTTFLNAVAGGGDGFLAGGTQWYRLHFTLGTQHAASKVLVEFEGTPACRSTSTARCSPGSAPSPAMPRPRTWSASSPSSST